MQKGLYLKRKNKYIEKYNKDSEELSLIAKGDGAEVMLHNIKRNNVFFISPGKKSHLMEFCYILDGEILYKEHDDNYILKQGDYFYVHHLKETVELKAVSDVTLLYLSTQPVFHYLSKRIKELRDISIKCQIKDMYTHDHEDRVKVYAEKIGNKLGLPKEKIDKLVFASLFHDIGKINVPDEILKKPDSLTREEMDYIKKHPLDGAQMVENTYYKDTGKIIEQHHERLDGSGYPHGLMSYEICIEAKIIAISDSYDAMITNRPYKKAMSPSEALNELKILSGIYYDEKAVNAFEEILIEEGIIKG